VSELALFGVVRSGHPLASARVALPTITMLDDGELAVVVAPVAPGHTIDDDGAVSHLDVLSRLVVDGPVLPFPLGTVAPNAQAARQEVLVARAGDLSRQMDLVADVLEARVTLTFDPQDGVRAAAAADPALRGLADTSRALAASLDQRLRLGEAVLASVGRWWDEQVARLLSPVAAISEQSAPLPAPDDHCRRRAFLVRRDRWHELEPTLLAVQAVAAAEGARVVALGPIPVYSFLEHLGASSADPPDGGPADWPTSAWSGSPRWGW
jgi:hypothetical protein